MARKPPRRTRCPGSLEEAWLHKEPTKYYNGGSFCNGCNSYREFKKRSVRWVDYGLMRRVVGTFKVHYTYEVENVDTARNSSGV